MAKNKSVYICQECGYESSGWLGKCPACSQWNTFVEEIIKSGYKNANSDIRDIKPVSINDVNSQAEERYHTGFKEIDRVLGGGLVKGSLILVGGDPGIGKSTLILQICNSIVIDSNILYFSGEESIGQIKIRADRLSVNNSRLLMVSETNFNIIESVILKENPGLVIIDSIQRGYNFGSGKCKSGS